MYGTLCFLALIGNSTVFIYPGQFLPAFWSTGHYNMQAASRLHNAVCTWYNTHSRHTTHTHWSGSFNKASPKMDRVHACALEGSLVLICSQSSIAELFKLIAQVATVAKETDPEMQLKNKIFYGNALQTIGTFVRGPT